MPNNPRVFISYSHQNADYEEKVLNFSNKLRSEGIDSYIDLYEEAPSEGWPRWMENQIMTADFVLVICSKSYYEKYYSPKNSKGISWEVNIIYQHIYDCNSENIKFIPVFFDEGDSQFILNPIKSFTYYNIGTKEGYEKLYWRLRGVTKINKPPLGKLKPLPEKEKKTMFITSPIDIEKWDKARWRGIIFFYDERNHPILGIVYRDYSIGKDIFSEWKKKFSDTYADKNIKIDFIVPPFPKECWVYSDPERNYGNGYFVHIGPNINESTLRAYEAGIEKEELLLAAICRYQWMDEKNGSINRDLFKENLEKMSEYFLMPIGIRDDSKPINQENLMIDFDYAIRLKSATFRAGVNLNNNDICTTVLKKM